MKYKNKMRLRSDNKHLLDIFVTNSYYEIGTIGEKNLRNLLKGKSILLSEVIDFSIANMGVGSLKLDDNQVNSYLPIVNFLNLFEENQSRQLFITEGLYYEVDEKKQELFAPIVLIPVLISYEDGLMYVRMVSRPIANSVLVDFLKEKNIVINEEKLDSVYSIDRFIKLFNKENKNVRLENYITYASVDEATVIINHDKYSLENKYSDVLDNKYYINEETEIFNVTKLNYDQRTAVLKAKSGNSFAINGINGVGKTTTLVNIALDAVYRDKKVLFISNMSSTIKNVEEIISKLDLGFLVHNTLCATDKVYPYEENSNYIDDLSIKKELLTLYDKICEYEKNASGRIKNHRFLDIITNLLKNYNLDNDFKCDELLGLYRFEYEDIVNSLQIIEKCTASINFKKSLFVGIPDNNKVKYPNQVLTLLYQLHRLFSDLNNNRLSLEENFGVKKIDNYARYKNYINDISGLDISLVPEEWYKTSNFYSAEAILPELKNLIYAYQEHQLYIDWDYVDYQNIEIDRMIKTILGDYFTEEDNYKIDRIIISNKSLINRTKGAIQNYRLLNKSADYLRKIFKWDFNLNNNSHINEIIKLTNFLSNSFYHRSWVDIDKQERIYSDLKEIQKNLNNYILLSKQYNKYFNNKKTVEENINYLKKLIKSNKKQKKFADVDMSSLLDDIIDYNEIKDLIPDLNERHINITGFPYDLSYDTTLDFKKFIEYINGIEDEEIRNHICKFLSEATDEDFEVNNQELNSFMRSYNIILDIYDYISSLVIKDKVDTLEEKVKFLSRFSRYLNNVFKTNLEMIRYLKDSKRRISLDVYVKLRNELKQVNRIKKELHEKTDFSLYFGKLFNYENTNLSDINNIISAYKKYIDCFTDDLAIYNSFNLENSRKINDILNLSKQSVYEVNENFKLYNKIFKDGIGNYYYDDFDQIINYLYKLMNAKDELKTYLELTSALQVIDKYKLFILKNYIIESNSTNLVDNFKYKYFRTLYDAYYRIDKFNHEVIKNDLNKIIDLEEELIKYHIYQLKNKRYSLFANEDNKKNNKQIFLSNTTYVNYELNIEDFDLVLIDDAHLSNANEYSLAINIPQVIIAGNGFMKNSLSSSLLMRMRNKNIIEFSRRYDITPLGLLRKAGNAKGVFYNDIESNIGYEIVSTDLFTLIKSIINANPKASINCFIPSLDDEIELVRRISESLISEGYSKNEIIDLHLNNINIVDIFSGHVLNADYNILDIESYYLDEKDFHEVKQIISLAIVRKKVFIIDRYNRLSSNEDNKVLNLIKAITKEEEIFRENNSVAFKKLEERLAYYDITLYGRCLDYSFVIKRNGNYYPVILFADPGVNNANILEIYRESFIYPSKYGKVLFVWLLAVLNNFDEVINYILKETS